MSEAPPAETGDPALVEKTARPASRGNAVWWGVVLIAAALALGFAMALGLLDAFDRPLLKGVAFTRADTPDATIAATQALTTLGDPSVRSLFVLAALVALAWRQHWHDALVFVVTVGVAIAANTALKEAFARPRPALVPRLDDIVNLSYPSGHAASTMAVLLLAALLLNRRWLVAAAVALALAIGVTRVLLGVHWPSDVLGGWLFGSGCALVGYAFGDGLRSRRSAKTA